MSDIGLISASEARSRRVDVCTVDGLDVLHRSIAADDRRGWVLVWSVDEEGRHVINERGDELKAEIITGHVEMRLRRRVAGW